MMRVDAGRLDAPLQREGRPHRWLRPLLALDPGLAQLRTANRAAASITLALVAEWVFVGTTRALQVPVAAHPSPAAAATAALQHHDMLVVAMLLGALVANLQGINGNEVTLGPQLVTITYIGAAISASLALGLAIGAHRDVALVVMVALLVLGSAGRRFGQRGAVTGLLLFIGYFYGFFLSSALGVSAAGWMAAEAGVATGAAVLVRLAFFRPSAAEDLRLAMATYDARVRKVLRLAADLATEPDGRRRRAAQRWLVRLGEAALIVDGQLARGATAPEVGDDIHRRVFDAEVAVTNLARFAEMLGTSELPRDRRTELSDALLPLAEGDVDAARRAASSIRAGTSRTPPADEHEHTHWVLRHRFANALDAMADTLARWPAAPSRSAALGDRTTNPSGTPAFNPAVTLRGGLLPGSADVSVEAQTLPDARVRLAPYVRTAAQMAVAVSIAIVAGDALDAQRFYWAVVAALLALIGTNTVAEQLRKAAYRIAGTLAGVVVGTALVDAVGHHSVWSLVAVVAAMWIGVAFLRANYAVLAMAVTISLSQAYLSLGEFSNGLLWERLAETAVGAGAAMLTVVVVAPLRTRRVLDVALAGLVQSVADLATEAAGALGGGSVGDLRATGREVDASYQALVATARPLRLVGWTDSADRVTTAVAAATAARNYARNLVADAHPSPELDHGALEAGAEVLCASAGRLAGHLRGAPAERTYLRAAALFAEAGLTGAPEPRQPARPGDGPTSRAGGQGAPSLAIRDLMLLDNALAALASASGFTVERLAPAAVLGGRVGTDRAEPRACEPPSEPGGHTT